MRIILLKDVPKVGRKYEVADVKDGFGLNFLIPHGMARIATPGMEKEYSEMKLKEEEEIKRREDELVERLERIAERRVVIRKKANKKGHLFASVSAKNIAEEVTSQLGFGIDERHVALEKPLEEVGEHSVAVSVGGKNIDLIVVVEAE